MIKHNNSNSLDVKYIVLFALDKVPVLLYLEIVSYWATPIVLMDILPARLQHQLQFNSQLP